MLIFGLYKYFFKPALILSYVRYRLLKKINRHDSNKSFNFDLQNNCKLESYIKISNLPFSKNSIAPQWLKLYLDHYFNILGSGWVPVSYFKTYIGFNGYQYNKRGQHIEVDEKGEWLKDIVHKSSFTQCQNTWRQISSLQQFYKTALYAPIDWQLDFKSGYRWSAKQRQRTTTHNKNFGADIKVPRELARMQHLVQLAACYNISRSEKECNEILSEFCSQIFDFISANPLGFGVNWQCSMDVGIRAVNWLVAYDLLKAKDAEFPQIFESCFIHSLFEHGYHIINNLEWHPLYRHNHYLADIVGLLFIASYLPRTSLTDAWLAFSVQEFIKEVQHQFYQEGTNFEGSTCYHCLSAEMVVYGVALILGLSERKIEALKKYDHKLVRGQPRLEKSPIKFYPLLTGDRPHKSIPKYSPIPPEVFVRLEKMAEFIIHITKPNNKVVQIGDNDSGRLIKVMPVFESMTVQEAKKRYKNLAGYNELSDQALYYDEKVLDYRSVVAAINGLFDRQDFTEFSGEFDLPKKLVQALCKGTVIQSFASASRYKTVGNSRSRQTVLGKYKTHPQNVKTVEIQLPRKLDLKHLAFYPYKQFGLFIYRSNNFFLSIRCGPIGRDGKGGHAHNDQLSIELYIDGKNWIMDPGTYVYTADPQKRNQYRSIKAHFAPQYDDKEPEDLDIGLFTMSNRAKANVCYADKKSFIGVHKGFGFPVYRWIELFEQYIQIKDFYKSKRVKFNPQNNRTTIDAPLSWIDFSPGYGIIENSEYENK